MGASHVLSCHFMDTMNRDNKLQIRIKAGLYAATFYVLLVGFIVTIL